MIATAYEVVSRVRRNGEKLDRALASTSLGAVAAARCLLRDASAAGYPEPVCDFLVYGRRVLVGVRASDLTRKVPPTKERES